MYLLMRKIKIQREKLKHLVKNIITKMKMNYKGKIVLKLMDL